MASYAHRHVVNTLFRYTQSTIWLTKFAGYLYLQNIFLFAIFTESLLSSRVFLAYTELNKLSLRLITLMLITAIAISLSGTSPGRKYGREKFWVTMGVATANRYAVETGVLIWNNATVICRCSFCVNKFWKVTFADTTLRREYSFAHDTEVHWTASEAVSCITIIN